MSHSFLISEEIHLRPEILSPRDCRYAFFIYSQLCGISPIRACSKPVLFFFKVLATGVGRGGWGGQEVSFSPESASVENF